MNGISDQALRETLRTMYQLRTTTRANIIEVTRLSAGIVSQALQLLLRRGMILKVGELESDGGRRKEVLTLNQEAIYFIGVDLESHRIRFGLTNLGGDIRYRWEEEVETTGSMDVRRLFDGIEKVAGTLNSEQRSRLQAVGISYPGVMDPQGRLTAVNLGWRKFPFMSELEKVRKAGRLDELPIFLEPDAQGNMRAELLLGRAQHHRNGIYVSCDRGIGLGILLDGKVVEGSRNMAGELGHVTVDPDAQDRC